MEEAALEGDAIIESAISRKLSKHGQQWNAELPSMQQKLLELRQKLTSSNDSANHFIKRKVCRAVCRASKQIIQFQNFMAPYVPAELPCHPKSIGKYCFGYFDVGKTHLPFDLIIQFCIGDFDQQPWSCHFNPESEWYNGNFGAYGLLSHKENGLAWGFSDAEGTKIDMEEIKQVFELDFKHLTAGAFGCKPQDRFFTLNSASYKEPTSTSGVGKYFQVDFHATVPSVLYDSSNSEITIDPRYSMIFGVPPPEYVKIAGKSWQKVNLKGSVFIRQAAPKITIVWGAVMAADHPKCDALIEEILQLMKPAFESHVEKKSATPASPRK